MSNIKSAGSAIFISNLKQTSKMESLKIPDFSVIAGMHAESRAIGLNNDLPWKVPEDMGFFTKVTSCVPPDVLIRNLSAKNAVVMGHDTYKSFKGRLLPNRIHAVISADEKVDLKIPEGNKIPIKAYTSIHEALHALGQDSEVHKIFVIGGQSIYTQVLGMRECKEVFLTRLQVDLPECDRFMPKFEQDYDLEQSSKEVKCAGGVTIVFEYYKKKTNKEEQQYLSLIRDILQNGEKQTNRTGTDAVVVWGRQTRWDLSESFPLLTTKHVFWKGVVEEALWFIEGCTDAEKLSDKDVTIWNGNSGLRVGAESNADVFEKKAKHSERMGRPDLAEFFRSRKPGDCGPVYGFNWRHFGAKYVDSKTDYTGQGFDQLANVVKRLREEPTARDIMLTSYDPVNAQYGVLYPCHVLCHFMVSETGRLNCHMVQRSCDVGLGVPFNIASYALLTCLLAKVCGFKRGELVHTMSNAHIYVNHLDQLNEQAKRDPYSFPKLEIAGSNRSIDGWKAEDFSLVGYNHHANIKMSVAL